MAAERQIPGGPFLNEVGTAQRQIPDGPFVNETVSVAGGSTVTPGAGALSLAGYAPTVGVTQSAAVGLGALTLTGYAPTVGITQSATTGLGALTITGYEPTVTATSGQTVSVSTGALTLTGYAPTVGVTYSASPNLGSLTITGYQPTVDVTALGEVRLSTGELILTGYAPTVVVPIIVGVDLGSLTLTGYAPEVVNSGDVVTPVAGQQPAGKARKTRKKRYQVEIDGEVLEVSSLQEAHEVLEKAKSDAEALAKLTVERAAKAKKRTPHDIRKDARKALLLPNIVAPALPDVAAEVQAAIEQAYQSAINAIEIELLLRKAEQDDEDDVELLLLL
jgi:hypothetical protein